MFGPSPLFFFEALAYAQMHGRTHIQKCDAGHNCYFGHHELTHDLSSPLRTHHATKMERGGNQSMMEAGEAGEK